MSRQLSLGSEAIAEAAIAAGCRFFAGYPMTPFTELLESFAAKLPAAGGVCINAESELEAIGMAWGALATGIFAGIGFGVLEIGRMEQILYQLIGIVASWGWSFVLTALILLALKYTIGLRVDEQDEEAGLDLSQHGEGAYSG